MDQKESNVPTGFNQILERLHSIEARITRIESKILDWDPDAFNKDSSQLSEVVAGYETSKSSKFSELNVGRYGLSWLANIVYVLGIGFIMTYIKDLNKPILATVIGFAGVLGMFIFGYLLSRRQFKYISFLIHGSAFLLLFYVIAYLHFLSSPVIIDSKWLVLLLLFGVIVAQLSFTVRKQSETLSFVGVLMIVATAIFSNTAFPMLILTLLVSALVTYFFLKYNWWRVFLISLFLVYLNHIFWLFNNPLLGNPVQTAVSHQYNLVYLFGYGIIFSLPAIFKGWKDPHHGIIISMFTINALLFFITTVLVIISFYEDSYAWIFALISVICLLYSIVLQKVSEFRYSPAFYACFGFISLSIAIYGYFDLPGSFLLLALQNLLVLGMALWFRSTIIIIVNTILFLILLIVYLTTSESVDSINFVFAFTGLLTARILNWKKDRLTIKTETLRNFYLFPSFIMVLYAFYNGMPSQYVTLSWTAVATVYFMLSFILKNVKYRWMAIGTFLVTAGYLFIVDLQHMSMIFRISSLLTLAIISLVVSLYYARRNS